MEIFELVVGLATFIALLKGTALAFLVPIPDALNEALATTAFSLVEMAVTKLGRSHASIAYIRP